MKAKRMLGIFLAGVLFFALFSPAVRACASKIEQDNSGNGPKTAAQSYAVAFDAKGVEPDSVSSKESHGQPDGALPTPVRTNHTFADRFIAPGKTVTGDNAAAIFPIIIMTVSLAGAAYLTYRKKRD